MRAAPQFFPGCGTHRIRSVADHRDPAVRGTGARSDAAERVPEIAVTAGNGDHGTGWIDAGAGDDPLVDGVACHYTAPEKGGLIGAFGLAEQTSDISLACRQYGPIKFKGKFEQGDVVFSERRSIFFKKMQIVRGCDAKRNILVYMTYSDKLIDGSPKNSTSTVPIEPWGSQGEIQKCADFVR